MSYRSKFTFLLSLVCVCLNFSCENVTARVRVDNVKTSPRNTIKVDEYLDVIPPSELKIHDEHHLDEETTKKFQSFSK